MFYRWVPHQNAISSVFWRSPIRRWFCPIQLCLENPRPLTPVVALALPTIHCMAPRLYGDRRLTEVTDQLAFLHSSVRYGRQSPQNQALTLKSLWYSKTHKSSSF